MEHMSLGEQVMLTVMEDRTRPTMGLRARKVWPVNVWLEEQKRQRADEALIQCGKAADLASKLAKKSRDVFEELAARPLGLAEAKAGIVVSGVEACPVDA